MRQKEVLGLGRVFSLHFSALFPLPPSDWTDQSCLAADSGSLASGEQPRSAPLGVGAGRGG